MEQHTKDRVGRVCAPRTPLPEERGEPERTWSLRSLVLLTATAAVLLGAALWHLAMVFLSIAPPSPVQRAYAPAVEAHVHPEFAQDWKLFAPQPLQVNVRVEARVRTAEGSGARRTGRWTSLTARDIAGVRHSLLPSHADQNLLRRAWDFYRDTHDRREAPTAARGALSAEYLKRIALSRLAHGPHGPHGPHGSHSSHGEGIVAVQVRSRAVPVTPPRWSAHAPVRNTPHRTLPWWPVTHDDHRGL